MSSATQVLYLTSRTATNSTTTRNPNWRLTNGTNFTFAMPPPNTPSTPLPPPTKRGPGRPKKVRQLAYKSTTPIPKLKKPKNSKSKVSSDSASISTSRTYEKDEQNMDIEFEVKPEEQEEVDWETDSSVIESTTQKAKNRDESVDSVESLVVKRKRGRPPKPKSQRKVKVKVSKSKLKMKFKSTPKTRSPTNQVRSRRGRPPKHLTKRRSSPRAVKLDEDVGSSVETAESIEVSSNSSIESVKIEPTGRPSNSKRDESPDLDYFPNPKRHKVKHPKFKVETPSATPRRGPGRPPGRQNNKTISLNKVKIEDETADHVMVVEGRRMQLLIDRVDIVTVEPHSIPQEDVVPPTPTPKVRRQPGKKRKSSVSQNSGSEELDHSSIGYITITDTDTSDSDAPVVSTPTTPTPVQNQKRGRGRPKKNKPGRKSKTNFATTTTSAPVLMRTNRPGPKSKKNPVPAQSHSSRPGTKSLPGPSHPGQGQSSSRPDPKSKNSLVAGPSQPAQGQGQSSSRPHPKSKTKPNQPSENVPLENGDEPDAPGEAEEMEDSDESRHYVREFPEPEDPGHGSETVVRGRRVMLEVCVDNIQSVIAAARGGAKRIELCSALSEGGLTPTTAFLSMAKAKVAIPIFVMIRPRCGDFVYSDQEIQLMIIEIEHLKSQGADGFVFGALTKDGSVDEKKCKQLLKAADPYPCTFHRAFDLVSHPLKSLRKIMRLGFSRILTSGQQPSAYLGIPYIKQLVNAVKKADGNIKIMAGAGVTAANVEEIVKRTGVKEVHASARSKVISQMVTSAGEVSMGSSADDSCHFVTDFRKVREIVMNANIPLSAELKAKVIVTEEPSPHSPQDQDSQEGQSPDTPECPESNGISGHNGTESIETEPEPEVLDVVNDNHESDNGMDDKETEKDRSSSHAE